MNLCPEKEGAKTNINCPLNLKTLINGGLCKMFKSFDYIEKDSGLTEFIGEGFSRQTEIKVSFV